MPVVTVGPGAQPTQVDDFGPDVQRSVRGAVYVRPSSTLELTDGELAHIQAKHPHIYARLILPPAPALAREGARAPAPVPERETYEPPVVAELPPDPGPMPEEPAPAPADKRKKSKAS